MSDDVITGVGALILIGGALCPFFPQACPAVAGLRVVKTYLEKKKKADEDAKPRPDAPQDVTVKAEEDESQESQSHRVRV